MQNPGGGRSGNRQRAGREFEIAFAVSVYQWAHLGEDSSENVVQLSAYLQAAWKGLEKIDDIKNVIVCHSRYMI